MWRLLYGAYKAMTETAGNKSRKEARGHLRYIKIPTWLRGLGNGNS